MSNGIGRALDAYTEGRSDGYAGRISEARALDPDTGPDYRRGLADGRGDQAGDAAVRDYLGQRQGSGPPVLIRDDPGWSYRGASGVSVRRLRVWWTGLGQVVAVITEQRDRRDQPAGTSITNAAEVIAARLAAQYAGEDIVQIEHYGEIAPEVKAAWRSQPPVTVTDIGEDGVTSYRFGGENTDPPLAAESYDRVTIEPGRAPRWERAHPGLLVWLGLRSR